jgi:AcrR family transcriptional regulator
MVTTRTSPLNGRKAQAARNDQRILDAARTVFTGDPGAPIAAVAERAGVGISALYRRYRSKDELLQRLCLDGLRRYIAEAEAALADATGGDPWTAFTGFMRRCLDAGTSSLTLRFAGTFPTTEELNRAGRTAHAITQRLLDRAQSAGVLRADIAVGDLSLLFEQLQAVHVGDQQRTSQLRQRYLALVLDGLHIPRSPSTVPLPGPPPTWEEISGRYNSENPERD